MRELDENLIKTASATEALQALLKNEIAVVLVDVCMPDLDGFELAAMIREHPRFQRTAIIFISAVLLTDADYLRGYEMGGVDYVPVPVVPELLRAKVRVFAELYRKTRELEKLNHELERRVAERTAELEASAERLRESERSRSIALAAGQMGSWEWDLATGECVCDAGQLRIFGVEPSQAPKCRSTISANWSRRTTSQRIEKLIAEPDGAQTFQTEIRVIRPNDETRHCACTAAITTDAQGRPFASASSCSTSPTASRRRSIRCCLRARSITARAMRSPWCRPSFVSHTPIRRKVMWPPSRGASMRSRRRIRCCRKHAGKAPILSDLSARRWRHIAVPAPRAW